MSSCISRGIPHTMWSRYGGTRRYGTVHGTYCCISHIIQVSHLGVGVDEGVDGVQLGEAEGVEHTASGLGGNPDHPLHGAHRERGGRSGRLPKKRTDENGKKASEFWKTAPYVVYIALLSLPIVFTFNIVPISLHMYVCMYIIHNLPVHTTRINTSTRPSPSLSS